MKAKILIAGGAGYIGSHVVKMLNQRGYETLVIDNLSTGHREFLKWGDWIIGDIGDVELLDSVFQKYPIEAVMHFSAYSLVGESVNHPQKYYENNTAKTLSLLGSMLNYDIKKFIFSSTCATYGLPQTIPITEELPQNPINPYGMSKLMVEKILQDFTSAYDLRFVSLRYFNAAGADLDSEIGEWHESESHLIPLVLDAALGRREKIQIFGTKYPTPDGTCIRDYIHVNDLAGAHILALEYLLNGGESDSFNLGNGNGYSVREVIETAKRVTGRNIFYEEVDNRPGDPPILIGDSNKIRKQLNWNPEYAELDIIIESAWKWHKKLYEV